MQRAVAIIEGSVCSPAQVRRWGNSATLQFSVRAQVTMAEQCWIVCETDLPDHLVYRDRLSNGTRVRVRGVLVSHMYKDAAMQARGARFYKLRVQRLKFIQPERIRP